MPLATRPSRKRTHAPGYAPITCQSPPYLTNQGEWYTACPSCKLVSGGKLGCDYIECPNCSVCYCFFCGQEVKKNQSASHGGHFGVDRMRKPHGGWCLLRAHKSAPSKPGCISC